MQHQPADFFIIIFDDIYDLMKWMLEQDFAVLLERREMQCCLQDGLLSSELSGREPSRLPMRFKVRRPRAYPAYVLQRPIMH
jgi:hypothetical protein